MSQRKKWTPVGTVTIADEKVTWEFPNFKPHMIRGQPRREHTHYWAEWRPEVEISLVKGMYPVFCTHLGTHTIFISDGGECGIDHDCVNKCFY